MQKIVHAYVVVGVCGVSLSVVAAALLQGASALLKQSLPQQRLQLNHNRCSKPADSVKHSTK